jgi:WD40 repeat protein
MQHLGPISGIACHGGRYVATAGYDNQVILWDAATGRSLARGLHDHLVNQCDFDPRGEYLVTASSDYTARLWSLPHLRLVRVLAAHDDDVMRAAFSPDGERIATCSLDGTLAVFTRDGQLTHRLRGHTGMIENVDWSRDSSRLQSCGTDGTLRTWDAVTGECLAVKRFEGDLDVIVTLQDGGCFVGGHDGCVTHINADGGTRAFPGHASGVKRLALSPDQSSLISLSYDNSLVLWDVDAEGGLSEAQRSIYPDCVWARSAAFLDGERLVHGTFGSKYAVWNWADNSWDLSGIEPTRGLNAVMVSEGRVYAIGDAGRLICDGEPIGGPGTLCNFLVRAGDLILTGGQKGVVYDAVCGEALYAHHAPLNCGVAFESEGGLRVAVGAYSGDLIVFRLEQGRLTFDRVLKAHHNAIKGVATDGRRVFAGCADGELSIHDAWSLERLALIEGAHENILNDACAYRDGFATISRDLTLGLWRDEGPVRLPTRHAHSIKCVAADDAGGLIATGSYVGVVEVYDAAAGRWLDPPVRPTAAGVSSLTWHPGRGAFLAASYDGSVYEVRVERKAGKATVTAGLLWSVAWRAPDARRAAQDGRVHEPV